MTQIKPPIELLLRYMIHGGGIEEGGVTFVMSDTGDLYWISFNDDGTETFHGFEVSLQSFKAMAEKIGQDELWLKCCGLQIQDLD